MKKKPTKVVREIEVGILVDPDPEFISMVGRGANQTPWKFIKHDKGGTMKKYLYRILAKASVTPEEIKKAVGDTVYLEEFTEIDGIRMYTQFDEGLCQKGTTELIELSDDISLLVTSVTGDVVEGGTINIDTKTAEKTDGKPGLFSRLLGKTQQAIVVNGGEADKQKSADLGLAMIKSAVYKAFDAIVDTAVHGTAFDIDPFQTAMKSARDLIGDTVINTEVFLPETVHEKRGAKMSAARLAKLTASLAEIQKVVEELTAENNSDKTKQASSEEEEDMKKEEIAALIGSTVSEAIATATAPLVQRLDAIDEKMKAGNDQTNQKSDQDKTELMAKITSLEESIQAIKKTVIGDVIIGNDDNLPDTKAKGDGQGDGQGGNIPGVTTAKNVYKGLFGNLASEIQAGR